MVHAYGRCTYGFIEKGVLGMVEGEAGGGWGGGRGVLTGTGMHGDCLAVYKRSIVT